MILFLSHITKDYFFCFWFQHRQTKPDDDSTITEQEKPKDASVPRKIVGEKHIAGENGAV